LHMSEGPFSHDACQIVFVFFSLKITLPEFIHCVSYIAK